MAAIVIWAALCGSPQQADAAIINLQAYILLSLYDAGGVDALVDGSLVQIIGSTDNVIDPPAQVGSGLTGGTTGDDVILATITIDSSLLGIAGTFYEGNVFFESDDIKNMYIRFYDTTSQPFAGSINWGQSMMTNAEHHAFGVLEMDFVGGFSTTNVNTFVVIPEPATAQLFLIALILVAGYYYHIHMSVAPRLLKWVRRDETTVETIAPPELDIGFDARWRHLMDKIERYFVSSSLAGSMAILFLIISYNGSTLDSLLNAVTLILLIVGPLAVIITCEHMARTTKFISRYKQDERRDFF